MNIPPGFAQVNLVFDGVALPRGAQVTLGVNRLATAFDPDSLANAVAVGWINYILPLQMSSVNFREARCKFGPNLTGLDGTTAINLPGGAVAPGDSPQVAVLVRKIGVTGGRQGRGRMFVPGLTETQTDTGGTLSAASLNNYQDAFNNFHAFMLTQGYKPVILHQSPEVAPVDIGSWIVQSLLATQRRRLRKVGGRRRGTELPT